MYVSIIETKLKLCSNSGTFYKLCSKSGTLIKASCNHYVIISQISINNSNEKHMFTGLITHIATTKNLSKTPESAKLVISADNKDNKLSNIQLGESIALNGVCLTVTNINHENNSVILDFDISPETCDKTNLGNLKTNDILNFERALTLNDRLGGHIVTGHVDGLGKVLNITNHQDYLNS